MIRYMPEQAYTPTIAAVTSPVPADVVAAYARRHGLTLLEAAIILNGA
jgi:hypothetical protein